MPRPADQSSSKMAEMQFFVETALMVQNELSWTENILWRMNYGIVMDRGGMRAEES
jgi:hypothetical protein